MMIAVEKALTILVAIAWLGATVLNGACVLLPRRPAEKTDPAPARQSTCGCSGYAIPDEEMPDDDGEDRSRPPGEPSCPRGCPVCACAAVPPLPTWSPDSHRVTCRRLPADDVAAEAGYVRKDIDPPRA